MLPVKTLRRWLELSKTPQEFLRKIKNRSLVRFYRKIPYKPDFIAEKDWDTLIVLDACRFDIFSYYVNDSGNLTKFLSPGSSTPEWLVKNFSTYNMRDVIYISANPFGSYLKLNEIIGHNPFYKIMEVWKYDWNDELGTVHPSMVNKTTLKVLRIYPNKRYLIHYMQPHYPFIGNIRISADGIIKDNIFLPSNKKKDQCTVWDKLQQGLISVDLAWQAYASNLELVLSYIKTLLPNLTGKICITSDHGNVFGKFGIFYGHPLKTYIRELIEVPWFEVKNKGSFDYMRNKSR